jgi:adenylate cyclase
VSLNRSELLALRTDPGISQASARRSDPRNHHADRGFVVRTGLRFTAGMLAANALGALVTFVYAITVIRPPPGMHGVYAQTRLNLIAFACYLMTALLVGAVWSVLRFRPTLAWLLADRRPTVAERHTTLRQPGRQLVVHSVLWSAGVVLFLVLNAGYSWTIARDVALSTTLGGLSTCALGYLLAERLLRPVTARALVSGPPEPPAGPGVLARMVLAWTFGTGVPLLGAGLGLWIRGKPDALTDNLPVLFLVGAGLLAGLASMWLVARSIATPMASVRRAVRAIERGNTAIDVPVFDAGEIGQLQHAVNEMVEGLRESERVQDIFGRQVGAEVAKQVLSQGIELGGEIREVAILFVDLDGSTAFASTHSPQEVVELLNIFFGVVVDVIDHQGGVVNKFEGDGALCVFGAPVEHPRAATAALMAGRILRDRLDDLDHNQISVGIGISAGRVVAGNIGAESRFEYTVIGDPVNEASRLTDLSKERSQRLLAAQTVVDQADPSEAARWRAEESVVLPGRVESTRLATSDRTGEDSRPVTGAATSASGS